MQFFLSSLMLFSEVVPSGKSGTPVSVLWLLERVDSKNPMGEFVFLSFVLAFYPFSFHLSQSEFLWAQSPVDDSFQCSLHFTVPEAVNDGVQHGSHHRVGERQQLLVLRRGAGPGSEVCEDGSAIEKGDNQEVGGTGGEGLAFPLS